MASPASENSGTDSSPKEKTEVPSQHTNSEETLKTQEEHHEYHHGRQGQQEGEYHHEGDGGQRKNSPGPGQCTASTTTNFLENPDESLLFDGASQSPSRYHHSEASRTAEGLRRISSAPPTSDETSKRHHHHHHHHGYEHYHEDNPQYHRPHQRHHNWGNPIRPSPPPPYGRTYRHRHPHPDTFVRSAVPLQPHNARAYVAPSTGTAPGAPSAAYPAGMMPPPHISSFESHHSPVHSSGSGDVSDPNNVSSAGPPIVTYSPYPPSTPGDGTAIGYSVVQWAPIAPVTYVTDIRPNDVLSGRGGATNTYSGNKKFRSLVKEYQDRYLQAKKRDKPAFASIIVEQIRKNGGRFLRRVDNSQPGKALWFDIGDDRAREKTCQALREGAPEIRRRKKNVSGDEDDTRRSDSTDELNNERKFSSTFSSTDQTPDSSSSEKHHLERHATARSVVEQELDATFPKKEGPITIRPSSKFIPGEDLQPISVDQLAPEDREIYLRDFLPPDPTIRRKTGKVQILEVSRYAHGNVSRPASSKWPVVKV